MAKIIWLVFILIGSVLADNSLVLAEMSPNTAFENMSVFERARRRAYPGGVDEENLVVLDRLPAPRQKLTHKAIQAEVLKSLYKSQAKEIK